MTGLSVLMAAYNERPTIDIILTRVLAEPIVDELIIVDDGSTDGTREFLLEAADRDERIRIELHETNRGKGAAIRTALALATGTVVIFQDADLEYHPSDYAAVIEPIVRGRTRVAYGSRVLRRQNRYPTDSFRIGSFLVTRAANLLFDCRLTDEPTCYKAFDASLLKSLPLKATGFELCPEVTGWVRKRGETIVEVPVRYDRRTVAEGKKLRWRDGLIALWTLLRVRVTREEP